MTASMFGIQLLSEPLGKVAIVLVEALVLYAGYGALSRLAGQSIANAIRGE